MISWNRLTLASGRFSSNQKSPFILLLVAVRGPFQVSSESFYA